MIQEKNNLLGYLLCSPEEEKKGILQRNG